MFPKWKVALYIYTNGKERRVRNGGEKTKGAFRSAPFLFPPSIPNPAIF
nr:MAG TPA: hypothetical protein [Bacteriophage sp.]